VKRIFDTSTYFWENAIWGQGKKGIKGNKTLSKSFEGWIAIKTHTVQSNDKETGHFLNGVLTKI
jgi:hypothetical protein